MKIQTALLSLVVALFGSTEPVQANTDNTLLDKSNSNDSGVLLLADRRGKDRRENRQDDRGRQDDREERRDCREEEGVAGKDKRNCKQDSRQGKNNKDQKDDKDEQ